MLPSTTLDFTYRPSLPILSKGCLQSTDINSTHILTCSRDCRTRLYNLESPHELAYMFYVKDFIPQKAWFDDDAVYIIGNET